jgi:hypothetical protein
MLRLTLGSSAGSPDDLLRTARLSREQDFYPVRRAASADELTLVEALQAERVSWLANPKTGKPCCKSAYCTNHRSSAYLAENGSAHHFGKMSEISTASFWGIVADSDRGLWHSCGRLM